MTEPEDPRRSLWATARRRLVAIRGDLPFVLLDAVLVGFVYVALMALRFDGSVPDIWWTRFRVFLPAALIVHLIVNRLVGLYGPIWRYASIREAQRLFVAGLVTALAIPILASWQRTMVPLSVSMVGPVVATGLIGLSRFQARFYALHRRRPATSGSAAPVGLRIAILGAGSTGANLAREMRANPQSGMTPVAFLDDDPRKRDRSLVGVPVLGAIEALPGVTAGSRVHQALLAIRGADATLVQRAAVAAERAGIPLRVIPSMDELVSGEVGLRDARDVRIEDLLGRHQVATDIEGITRLLEGKRVLVTGGGGSIGSEIARQVYACRVAHLVLLDHDETHLHDAALDLPGAVQVLADVRDANQIERVFLEHRPEVVFHAAALKHVPILESHPEEAFRTNVVGTWNVLAAARVVGTERMIVISTDKAVRPENVMGASKRMAERLLACSAPPATPWCAVRFGNVLASRGSVVPTFARQIAQGGPVTVTDARMTRYFMSIREAVELVLQSAALSRGGEIFMLDMGDPVRILDLARRMVRLSGRKEGVDIEIRVTGVRPGEKLSESLHHANETLEPTEHPSIRRIRGAEERADELQSEVGELQRLCDRREWDVLAFAIKEYANRDGVTAPIDLTESHLARQTGPVEEEALMLTSADFDPIVVPDPTPLGGMPAVVEMPSGMAQDRSLPAPTQ
jgi:FlaA1/EpsC-like NDP-sugar epimerase